MSFEEEKSLTMYKFPLRRVLSLRCESIREERKGEENVFTLTLAHFFPLSKMKE